MRRADLYPVACPLAWWSTDGCASARRRCRAEVPATLWTCPSVASYERLWPDGRTQRLPLVLIAKPLPEQGGEVGGPVASRRRSGCPHLLCPAPPSVPAKVALDLDHLTGGRS
jgi:hypothetical protein